MTVGSKKLRSSDDQSTAPHLGAVRVIDHDTFSCLHNLQDKGLSCLREKSNRSRLNQILVVPCWMGGAMLFAMRLLVCQHGLNIAGQTCPEMWMTYKISTTLGIPCNIQVDLAIAQGQVVP